MYWKNVVLVVIALIIGIGIGKCMRYDDDGRYWKTRKTITTFEECVAAGYPVMESYPEQCRTKNGKTFTKQY